ncbi:hypothetical protein FDG2_2992 [Candidatus Protofrankia californiensis]|uniref:A-factor biosynthesis hotdog domain-containing protein n=1 Tax=Candidatus Protofrankia californiensis TaxID=1839754 RepID=A0A1C3NYQ2_9ACTN|nr:hypothetical protein FDG2_2992 [Candidatus Protofrankia californiensis]
MTLVETSAIESSLLSLVPGSDPPVPAPRFSRTVDRALVHRHAVSEVFITDLVETGSDSCLVGAQLPISHSYFLDSVRRPAPYDICLLTECARQACTYIAHERFGVPMGWVFMMTGMSTKLAGHVEVGVGDRPAELAMSARTQAMVSGTRLRGMKASIDVSVDSLPVGTISGEGRYLSAEEYEFLRRGERTGSVPSSRSLDDVPAGIRVPPNLVGRCDPRNVMLVDAHRTAIGVAAKLGVSGRHATLFDHPLDHYPGMALVEASVQAALLAVGLAGSTGTGLRAVGLDAGFSRFAELDDEVAVAARPHPSIDGTTGATTVDVSFEQKAVRLADIQVVLADPTLQADAIDQADVTRRAMAAAAVGGTV